MRLLHLANHGGKNIGNAALVLGLERVLREDLPFDVSFEPEPWDLYSRGVRRFDERFVERVNECDALLVGGAVAFDGRPGFVNTGFRFDLPLTLLERIAKPIVFYGLSYRSSLRPEYHHRDALRRALETLLASERVLFSVRNDGTKQWLRHLVGIDDARLVEVPDAGLYVPTESVVHPELADGRTNVIFAGNVEHERLRFGGRPGPERRFGVRLSDKRRFVVGGRPRAWRQAQQAFVARLAAAFEGLAVDRDLNLVLCAHEPADLHLALDLFGRFSDELKNRTVFAGTGLPNRHGATFYDLYAKSDLAVSMRIHSMNPAVGLATPVVPLVSSDRMRVFMRDAGLEDLCVEVLDPTLIDRLCEHAHAALELPDDARARLAAATAALRERTRVFNSGVSRFLQAS